MPKSAQEVLQGNRKNLSELTGFLDAVPPFTNGTLESQIASEAFLNQQNALKDLSTAIELQDTKRAEECLEQLSNLHTVMAMPLGDGRTVYDVAVGSVYAENRKKFNEVLQIVAVDLGLDLNVEQIQKGQEFHQGPDLKHAWEDDRFDTRYRYQTEQNMMAFLPNSAQMFGDMDSLAINNDTHVRNMDPPFAEFDQSKNAVAGAYYEQLSEGKYAMENVEQANTMRAHEARLSRELKRQGERRGDEKIKRLYDDLSYVIDPNNGNMSQAFLTSPYLFRLFSQFNQLVDPKKASSAAAKMDLGVPLYNATYDFMHAVTDELRTEYNRQRMEAEGPWTQEKEGQYLRELKEKHTEFVRRFDELNAFSDTNDGRVKQHLSNTLSEFFGRNSIGDRQIQMHAGMIRGELQAIDNGWGSKELSVLGMIGSMEQNLRAYENSANDPKNDNYRAFKSDLLKLKNECFNTKVTTAQAKKEIADKVRAFIDNHNTPEAMRIMEGTRLSRNGFEAACREVNIAAERERVAGFDATKLKSENPAVYLKALQQKAMESGNFSVYAAEVADVFAGIGKLPQEKQDALNAYWSGLERKEGIDNEFVWHFSRAMAQNQVKSGAALEQAKQEMANDIRDDRETVDAALGDVKHIPEAARMIAGQKLENSEMARQFENAKKMSEKMDRLFAGMMDNYGEYLEHAEKEYANDPTDGLSRQEKELYLNRSKEAPGQGLEKYGVQQEKNPDTGEYTVTQAPTKEQVKNELNRIINENMGEMNVDSGNSYRGKLYTLNAASKDLRTRLETLQGNRPTGKYNNQGQFVDAQTNRPLKRSDANSGAFMNMVEAMKKVNELEAANGSPLAINQALEDLDKAAAAYQRKINDQTFGGWFTSNGRQRLALAGELRQFVREQRPKFKIYENSEQMNPNETLSEQYSKINNAIYSLNEDILKAAQNQANNAPQENQANIQQPEKKEKVKEFRTIDDFAIHLKSKGIKIEGEENKRGRSNSVHERPDKGKDLEKKQPQLGGPGNL